MPCEQTVATGTIPRIMPRFLRLLAAILFLFLIVIGWFWWNRPTRVDMAGYVPADSLIYLESNSLMDAAGAITNTDAWLKLSSQIPTGLPQPRNDWRAWLAKITGLGSTPAVIATRAQVAFVLLDLTAADNGDALEFKSPAALIVETHTSQSRIKPAIENMLTEFTGKAYVHPRFERVSVEGTDAARWVAPDGQRHIVAAIDGSVAIIGNDERAVAACLATRHGQRPSMLRRAELEEMKTRVSANDALAFGYVSGPNAARLVSVLAPIVFGRLSQEDQFQKMIADGGSKLIGNVGWSAHAAKGGIEDNYAIAVRPALMSRMRPAFSVTQTTFRGGWELLPPEVYSVTSYDIREPASAWDSMNATISSQLDVVSAVVFTTAFRALLAPYGIDEPDTFLKAIKPEVLTVRMDSQSERSLIIAGVASPDTLHKFVSRRFGVDPKSERVGEFELVLSPEENFAASFAGDYFLLGAPEDVRRCLTARSNRANLPTASARLDSLTHYFERPSSSAVVTFSDDGERTKALLASVAAIRGSRLTESQDQIDRIAKGLPAAVTETSLVENGINRRTRSAFGQFGFMASFLAPQPQQP